MQAVLNSALLAAPAQRGARAARRSSLVVRAQAVEPVPEPEFVCPLLKEAVSASLLLLVG